MSALSVASSGCTTTELRNRIMDSGPEMQLEDGSIEEDGSNPLMDGSLPDHDGGDRDSTTPMLDGTTPDPDGSTPTDDGSTLDDAGDASDAGDGSTEPVDPPTGCEAAERSIASAQIALARAAADGMIDVTVSHAFVTGTIPAVGIDPAGFFIQAETTGPALFVRIDPTTLDPEPKAGDCIEITLEEMLTVDSQRFATLASDFSVLGEGHDLEPLTQDVSSATDVVTDLGSYEAELLYAEGTLSSAFVYGGADHVRANLATVGLPSGGATQPVLRLPATLQVELDLVEECEVRVLGTPLWRYNASAQISAWRAEDLEIEACPAPRVASAQATASTTVVVQFDRHIDPASVHESGNQFVFTGGLSASAASVDPTGRSVTVTTSAQAGGTSYGVAVTTSVRDTVGSALASDALGAIFLGYQPAAVVVINEVNANLINGCDLVELRVVEGGSMDGLVLWNRDAAMLTFSLLSVEANDIVVVHLGDHATCNANNSSNETSSATQYLHSNHATNYDSAYDWFAPIYELTNTTNTLLLRRSSGAIVDAVLLADDASGVATNSAELRATEAAGSGQWTALDGSVPATGFVDGAFRDHAVLDLNATGTDLAGVTIQRIGDLDRQHKGDWNGAVMPVSSWGFKNAGQTDF